LTGATGCGKTWLSCALGNAAWRQHHVKDGKQCTRLALTWDDKISFVLTDNLDIKRISAVSVIDQSLKNASKEEIPKFESDFMLMSEEFNAMLNDLLEVLGGEFKEDLQSVEPKKSCSDRTIANHEMTTH